MRIVGFDTWKGLVYMNFTGLAITEKIENIEPIPLTKEILEKNGFDYYFIGHGDYGWCLFKKDKYGEKLTPFTLTLAYGKDIEFIWGPEIDDNESYYIYEMGRIKYVHELQHLLKDCKIEKEVIL